MSWLAAAVFLGASGRPATGWRDPRGEWDALVQGTVDEARLVVRDEALWEHVWSVLVRGQEPRGSAPAVDFSTSMLILAARGQCASGGFGIEFVGIEEGDREIVATVRNVDAEPGAFVTLAITYPIAIALLPVSEHPVRFVEASPGGAADR